VQHTNLIANKNSSYCSPAGRPRTQSFTKKKHSEIAGICQMPCVHN